MDGFSYHNIFATKGIEYIIVIGFLIILIPFWLRLNKQAKITAQIRKVLGVLTSGILKVPKGLYFSSNHTWTYLERSGEAIVGLDDLLKHIVGEIKFTKLENPGVMINKGDLLTEVFQNGKLLRIFSPISGEILKTNLVLEENPEILNADPYEQGWIYKIKPSNWIAETSSYYLAEDAIKWTEGELERFKDFLAVSLDKHSPGPSMVALQDGGELRDHTLSELPGEIWQDFQKEFLNI